LTVAQAWKRNSRIPGLKVQVFKYTYGNGDTSISVVTDLKIIYGYTVSPTSVTGKAINYATVSGGTISITAADPLAGCYIFVTAWGLPK
jgi:hypothetical protein